MSQELNDSITFAVVLTVIIMILLLFCVITQPFAGEPRTAAEIDAEYEQMLRDNKPDYKSTKSLSEMDGYERKQLNEAWDTMSDEEKRIQLEREFGPFEE